MLRVTMQAVSSIAKHIEETDYELEDETDDVPIENAADGSPLVDDSSFTRCMHDIIRETEQKLQVCARLISALRFPSS